MGLLDLLGGGDFPGSNPSALYTGLLSSPEFQRELGMRQLSAMAGAFGRAAMPSRAPIPIGATLGLAGEAAGNAGDEVIKARQQAASSLANQRIADIYAAILPDLKAGRPLGGMFGGAGGAGSGSTGSAATDPSAGGDGGGGGAGGGTASTNAIDDSLPSEARALLDTIAGPESGGKYDVRYTPSGGVKFDSFDAHPRIYEPGPQGRSSAAGRYQIVASTYDPLSAETGITDFSPKSQDQLAWRLAQNTYRDKTGRDLLSDLQAGRTGDVASALHGQWATLNMGNYARNLGKYRQINQTIASGLPEVPTYGADLSKQTRSLPLLAEPPTADAGGSPGGDYVPPSVAMRGVPGVRFNSKGMPYAPQTAEETARVEQSMRAIRDAQRAGRAWNAPLEGSGGGVGNAPPLTAGDEGPAGSVGPVGPTTAGTLSPGGALTRGAPASALPLLAEPSVPAAPPAAPAPAAAAPAPAPGATPGLPSAAFVPPKMQIPPVPSLSPEQQRYFNAIAIASGLPGLGGLIKTIEMDPAYQARMAGARKAGELPYLQAEELFKKQVEINGVGPIEAAKLPYALAKSYFDAEQRIREAGPVAAAQNFERIKADNAAKGIVTTMGPDGQIKISLDPAAVKVASDAAQSAASATARGTGENELVTVQRQGPNGPYETQIPRTQYIDEMNRAAGGPGGGVAAPGTAPTGSLVGKPYLTQEELQSRELDLKTLESKRVAAESARLAIQNANDIRQLIEQGAILGPGAPQRTQMLKLGQLLGLTGKNENELIANTEAFISRQGAELKNALQGLGPPVSDRDLQTAANIAGNQNLTPQGLLELMKIKEKYHRQALTDYNRMAAQAPPGRFDRTVKEPPAYGAPTATGPGGQRIWKDPTTGEWKPF